MEQCPCKNCLVFPICKARSKEMNVESIYIFCEDVIKCKDAVEYMSSYNHKMKVPRCDKTLKINIMRRLFGMDEI